MTWSGVLAIWKNWALGLISALSAALVTYWQTAPNLLRIAAYALGPLLLVEAWSAVTMQRQARKKAKALGIPIGVLKSAAASDVAAVFGQMADALKREYGVVLYPDDTWSRAGLRFGMTLLLLCLAGAVDSLLGTRHMTVLWVALWGTSGHARASLRHLQIVAQLNHMKLPIFPDDRMERLDALTPEEQKPGKETPDGA